MMERALKERIIGAVVLVLFVVLVVPVFLDGPPADGQTVTQRVLLPGQEGQQTKTVVLERGRSVPIPAAISTPPPAQPESKPKATESRDSEDDPTPALTIVAPAEPTKKVAADVVAATSSTTGMWAVQLGSFVVKENAENLQADLRKQGYAAFLSQIRKSGKVQYRVRVGPQKDRIGAESTAARLLKANHRGQVVPHP
jgi:DedD protein